MPRTAPPPRYHAIPVIGWIARDIANDPGHIWYALVIAVTLITLAIMAWGIVALAMTALLLVPAIFAILIAITMG